MKAARWSGIFYLSFLLWLLAFPPWVESSRTFLHDDLDYSLGRRVSAVSLSIGHHWRFSVPLHWEWSQADQQSFLVPNLGARIDYRLMLYEALIGLVASILLWLASSTFVTLSRKVTAWANAEINQVRERFRGRRLRSRDSIVDRQAANLAAATAALTGEPMADVAKAGEGKPTTAAPNAPQGPQEGQRSVIRASTDPEELRKSAEAQKAKFEQMAKAVIAGVGSLDLPHIDVAHGATWEEIRRAVEAQLRGIPAANCPPHLQSENEDPAKFETESCRSEEVGLFGRNSTAEAGYVASTDAAHTDKSGNALARAGHQEPPVQTLVDELSMSSLKRNPREPLEVLQTYPAFQNLRGKAETHEYQFRPKEYARLEKNGQLDQVMNERTMSAWNVLADARRNGANLMEAEEVAYPLILLPGENQPERETEQMEDQ